MLKNAKYERLRWACRRGMLELDLLLTPFYDDCFAALQPNQQAEFETLLTFQDQQLYHWFLGIESADVSVQAIVARVKEYRYAQSKN